MNEPGGTDSLFDADVLAARGDRVTTTDRFESLLERYGETSPSREEVASTVRDRVGDGDVVEPLVDLCAEDPRTLAELCALEDLLGSPPLDALLGVLPTLRLFRPDPEPTDGVPDSFVPVPALHVPALSRIYSRCLVYVWLEDCPPCDTVRADLEALFSEPRGVMAFAVYGPASSEFLLEEYDVNAGPALLFMRDGRVDVRLYGAQPRETLESELETLCR